MDTSDTNKVILIVEDQTMNLELIKIRLESWNYNTLTAEDGENAVEVFKNNDVDLILMDINMPKMDGWEATKLIRKIESDNSCDETPILALTGSAGPNEDELYLDAGMNGYLQKPIDTNKMKTTIQEYLSGKETYSQPTTMIKPDIESVDNETTEVLDFKKGLYIWNDRSLYISMLHDFVEEKGNTAVELEDYIKSNEWDKAYSLAHAFSGVAGNLSITKVYKLSKNIEDKCKNKQSQEANDILPVFKDELKILCDAVLLIKK